MPTNNESPKTPPTYEALGEPRLLMTSARGFIEVAHRRALTASGVRDFALISRGYFTKTGARRVTQRVTVPADCAGAVASSLAPGSEVADASERALEAGA